MTMTESRPLASDQRIRTQHELRWRDADIRPLITRHKLRRRRRRTAATLLTGASIALGAAAIRAPSTPHHAPATSPADARVHAPGAEPGGAGSGGAQAGGADPSSTRARGEPGDR
jgi:hypothetical protein